MNILRNEPINFIQINHFLLSAEQKLKNAERVIRIDEQIGFQMAYEAMLRASLGFMLSLGKRPRSAVGHHKIIVDFMAEELGVAYQSLIHHFDRMRRKRNEALYGPLSTITATETHDALQTARKFLKIIADEIHRRNPQQKLSISI